MSTTAILGGGLSGLCSAYYLSRTLPKSHKIILLEKSNRLGGWIQTEHLKDGVSFETGPRSVRPVGLSGLLTLELINELGLKESLVTVSKTHPAAKNRFIYYPDHLNKAPSSLASAIKASFAQDSPFCGLLQTIVKEPFRPRVDSKIKDESVDSFVTRRFSKSFAENVLSALVHGIYAGDTRKLSIRAVFPSLWEMEKKSGSVVRSLLRGGVKVSKTDLAFKKAIEDRIPDTVKTMKDVSVYSLKKGLERLPQALSAQLGKASNVEVRRDCSTSKVTWDGEKFTVATPHDTFDAKHLISSISSSSLDSVLHLPHLRANPSVTVAVVNLAFPKSYRLPIRGFGYLLPRTVDKVNNPHQVLGVVFDSEMFDDADAPVRLTVMMGGAYWTGRDVPPLQELEAGALETLRLHKIVPDDVNPIASQIRLQRDCIPQYQVGHVSRMQDLHQHLLSRFRGRLGLVGSSYAGVGLNDCVRSSWEHARRLVETGASTGLENFAEQR